MRNKLTNQQFGDAGCLVLSGAGGKHICAACLPLTKDDELVIDQTWTPPETGHFGRDVIQFRQ